MLLKSTCVHVLLLGCLCLAAGAQEAGSFVGTILDPHGAVLPGAKVILTSTTTGASRETLTDPRGSFEFNAVPAGTYILTAQQEGFKKFEKRNLNLLPNDRFSLGQINLEIGSTTEEVTVTAEGAAIQAASSERSGVITSEQVQHLTVVNRDFLALVALLPGVVLNEGSQSQGFNGSARFNANGGRAGQK